MSFKTSFPNIKAGQWFLFSHADLKDAAFSKPFKLIIYDEKSAYFMNVNGQTLCLGIFAEKRNLKIKLDIYDLPQGTKASAVPLSKYVEKSKTQSIEDLAFNKLREFANSMNDKGFGTGYHPETKQECNRNTFLEYLRQREWEALADLAYPPIAPGCVIS